MRPTTTLPVLDPGQRRRSTWGLRVGLWILVAASAAAVAYQIAAR